MHRLAQLLERRGKAAKGVFQFKLDHQFGRAMQIRAQNGDELPLGRELADAQRLAPGRLRLSSSSRSLPITCGASASKS
jgi:hypothetical protein